jgi:sterol desaturase/sphingolipid hydroxylase (fatty acid hydroxylase superfamily)
MAETFFSLWLIWVSRHAIEGFKVLLAAYFSVSSLKSQEFNRGALKRIFGNCFLYLGWTLITSLIATAAILVIKPDFVLKIGLFHRWQVADFAVILAAIFILDFGNYVLHNLEHRIPVLWRFHSVHHSDRELDVSTTIRKHPLTASYSGLFGLIVVLLFGIPAHALLVYNIIADVVGFWSHSSYAFSPRFNKIINSAYLISPDDHRVHHSTDRTETDSNFGQVFSFWDKIFGTYRRRDESRTLQYGLSYLGGSKLIEFPFTFFAPFKKSG